jgi:2-hydroxychromene-2-carboxylate isomerase
MAMIANQFKSFARRGLETVWGNEEDISDAETIRRVADVSGIDEARLLRRGKQEEKLVE